MARDTEARMKSWGRVAVAMFCGGCGGLLVFNDPVLTIQLPGVRRERWRGVCCAGDAPPELPRLEDTRTTKRLTPLRTTAATVRAAFERHR